MKQICGLEYLIQVNAGLFGKLFKNNSASPNAITFRNLIRMSRISLFPRQGHTR